MTVKNEYADIYIESIKVYFVTQSMCQKNQNSQTRINKCEKGLLIKKKKM